MLALPALCFRREKPQAEALILPRESSQELLSLQVGGGVVDVEPEGGEDGEEGGGAREGWGVIRTAPNFELSDECAAEVE